MRKLNCDGIQRNPAVGANHRHNKISDISEPTPEVWAGGRFPRHSEDHSRRVSQLPSLRGESKGTRTGGCVASVQLLMP